MKGALGARLLHLELGLECFQLTLSQRPAIRVCLATRSSAAVALEGPDHGAAKAAITCKLLELQPLSFKGCLAWLNGLLNQLNSLLLSCILIEDRCWSAQAPRCHVGEASAASYHS